VDEKLKSKKEQIIKEISHLAGVNGMIGGQLMDVTLSPGELTDKIFNELIQKKTGALIIASVKTGAILGGATNSELGAMVEYGKNIGIAFQIRDDILDSASEAQEGQLAWPNSVSLFGLEDSKCRVKNCVEAAKAALDEASLESEELNYLASKLLELGNRKGK